MPPPYTVLLVELADYPEARLVGQLRGELDAEIGDEVEVVFEELVPEVVLPNWRVVEK